MDSSAFAEDDGGRRMASAKARRYDRTRNKNLAKSLKTCFIPDTTASGDKALNAIIPKASPQAPELTARDLDMLQELAELGMQLARLAVQQAQQDQATEPRPRRADRHLIFIRLSTTIRETIVLRTRLAAGILPPPPRVPKGQPTEALNKPEDARRPLILRYFRDGIDLTQQKSKIATSQQIIETHIDAELAKDPDHRLAGRDILLKICKSLDLPFYANRMPGDLLRPPQPRKAA